MNERRVEEHEVEPVRGLPAVLPKGERVLWQGSPRPMSMALRAFHVGWVGAYFLGLLLWQAAENISAGAGVLEGLIAASPMLVPLLLAVGVLGGMAFAYARTTVYTITNKHVVLRTGLALTMTVSVPLKIVTAAQTRRFGDGSGNLALTLDGSERVSGMLLWPSVRPLRWRNPEPMLRSIGDLEQVADVLGAALRGEAPETQAPRPVRAANVSSQNAMRSAHDGSLASAV